MAEVREAGVVLEGDPALEGAEIFDLDVLVPKPRFVKFGKTPEGKARFHRVRDVGVEMYLSITKWQRDAERKRGTDEEQTAQIVAAAAIVPVMVPTITEAEVRALPFPALTPLMGNVMGQLAEQTKDVEEAAKNAGAPPAPAAPSDSASS